MNIIFVYTITSILFFWAGLYIGMKIVEKKVKGTINAMDKQLNEIIKKSKND